VAALAAAVAARAGRHRPAVRPLDAAAEQVAWLLEGAGLYRLARGESRAALPPWRRAHTLRSSHRGVDYAGAIDPVTNIAVVLYALGEYYEARTMNEDTLTLTRARRALGDDNPKTLTAANNLANDLLALGEHRQARAVRGRPPTRRPTCGLVVHREQVDVQRRAACAPCIR
jgi:hypothetical protein